MCSDSMHSNFPHKLLQLSLSYYTNKHNLRFGTVCNLISAKLQEMNLILSKKILASSCPLQNDSVNDLVLQYDMLCNAQCTIPILDKSHEKI